MDATIVCVGAARKMGFCQNRVFRAWGGPMPDATPLETAIIAVPERPVPRCTAWSTC